MQRTIQGKNGSKTVGLNRRKAIRERCLNCSGWLLAEVAECQFLDCPLYPYRSGQGRQDPAARNHAIKKYCLWCSNSQRAEVLKCQNSDCSLFPYRGVRTGPQKFNSMLKKGHIEATFQ